MSTKGAEPRAGRDVLVVSASGVSTDVVREEIQRYVGPDVARIRVVSAASTVSRLDWLMNDEDSARADASRMAEEVAAAVGPGIEADAELGDSDPVQAAEDALRTFPADELVLVTQRGADKDWLEQGASAEAFERFGLPVTSLVVDAASGRTQATTAPVTPPGETSLDDTGKQAARGKTARTPAVMLGSVAATVWGIAALVIVGAILLWLLT